MTCILKIYGRCDEIIDCMTPVQLSSYLEKVLGLVGGALWFQGRKVFLDVQELMTDGGVYYYANFRYVIVDRRKGVPGRHPFPKLSLEDIAWELSFDNIYDDFANGSADDRAFIEAFPAKLGDMPPRSQLKAMYILAPGSRTGEQRNKVKTAFKSLESKVGKLRTAKESVVTKWREAYVAGRSPVKPVVARAAKRRRVHFQL